MTPSELQKILADNPDLTVQEYAYMASQAAPSAPAVTALLMPQPPGPVPPVTHESEHDAQVAVFAWIDANIERWLDLASFFAVPNGYYRTPATAGRVKASGQRAGVPDILGLVPQRHLDTRYAGIAIELKVGSNKPSPSQREWLDRLRRNGFLAIVCYGAQDAIDAIKHYLYIMDGDA